MHLYPPSYPLFTAATQLFTPKSPIDFAMAVKNSKPKRFIKAAMQRLRNGIIDKQVNYCFAITSESINNIIGAVTPGGGQSPQQLNTKAFQVLQLNP